MRKTTIGAVVLSLVVAFCMVTAATPVSAQTYAVRELITLSPGEQQAREFGVTNFRGNSGLGPIEAYLVFATGDAGTLTATVKVNTASGKPNTTTDNSELVLDYGVYVIGYSLDLGPIFQSVTASTPYAANISVPIDSTFGAVWLGTYMSGVSGSGTPNQVGKPQPFKITLALSEMAPVPEPTE